MFVELCEVYGYVEWRFVDLGVEFDIDVGGIGVKEVKKCFVVD